MVFYHAGAEFRPRNFRQISAKNDRSAETILRGLGGFGALVMRGGLSYMMYDIKLVETGFIVTMYSSKMIYMY